MSIIPNVQKSDSKGMSNKAMALSSGQNPSLLISGILIQV
jgi:hypothetical protein